MKTVSLNFAALIALILAGNTAHAYMLECGYDGYGCRHDNASDTLWSISTSTSFPIAILADGSVDFSNPDTRAMAFAQAEQVLNGQASAINQSENLVHALAQSNDVSDESLARAVVSLEASGSEITQESLKKALK